MEGRKRRGEIGPIFPWPFNVRISCFEPSCKKLSFDTTIEVYRGSTRIQESVGRQPASCLHSSITGCRENSPAYCSSSIQLFPLSVSRRGSIVNPNRQRFKPRFFFKLLPHRLPPSRAWCTEKIANSFVDLRQYLPDENWIRPKRPLFST